MWYISKNRAVRQCTDGDEILGRSDVNTYYDNYDDEDDDDDDYCYN